MLKTFAYHKPSDEGLVKITDLRLAFSQLYNLIEQCCPQSRERAVALTNLETAAMWAIKSVVINDPKSTCPDEDELSLKAPDAESIRLELERMQRMIQR